MSCTADWRDVAGDNTKQRKPVSVLLPPDLDAIVTGALEADPEMDASKVIRRAIRFYGQAAPQAMDDIEMWALRAFRKLAERHPGLRAKAVLDLSVYASAAGAYLPPEVKDALVALSQQFDEASRQPADHSRDVRPTVRPRASKAR